MTRIRITDVGDNDAWADNRENLIHSMGQLERHSPDSNAFTLYPEHPVITCHKNLHGEIHIEVLAPGAQIVFHNAHYEVIEEDSSMPRDDLTLDLPQELALMIEKRARELDVPEDKLQDLFLACEVAIRRALSSSNEDDG